MTSPALSVVLVALALTACAGPGAPAPLPPAAEEAGPTRPATPPPVGDAAPVATPTLEATPGLDDVCAATGGDATTERPEGETPAYVTDLTCLERLAHEAAQRARVEAGLAPLVWDTAIAPVARAHSADMVRRDYVAHVSPDGDGPPERLAAAGVDCTAGSAENIAFTSPVLLNRFHTRDGQEVRTVVWAERALAGGEPVAMWLDSPPHRRNLLNGAHTRHAIGFAYDAAAQEYRVTQVLCV